MSSKQPCAVSQCANNAAAGKLYCIFHRQHNAQPSGEFAPSGAVAAAAVTPAVAAGPRVPPPPPPPQQQQQSATVAASAVSTGPPSLPVQPLRVPPPPPPPAQSANSATPPSLPPNRSAPPPPPPPPAQPSASSTPSYASSPSATPPALPAASTPSPISSASSASFVSPAVPLARGDSQPQPQSQNQRKSLGARFSSFTDSVKAKVESATSKSSPSPAGKTSSPVVISSPGSSIGSPSYGYGSGGGGGGGSSGRVAPAPPTIASLRPPPVLPSQPSHHHHSSSSSFGGSGSGSMGGEVIGIGSATAVRSGVPSISYTRLPSSSRFSLSSTVVPSFGAAAAGSQGSPGPSPSPNAGLGGTLDLSSLRTLQFQHLTHVPEVLSAQVDTGLYAVHRMVAVWRRTLALEEEHWRAHIRAYEHEAGKDRVDLDGAEITLGVWSAFQRYQVELAQVHLDFAQRLTIHALVPLLEFHPAAVLKKKELDRDILAREREFHSSRVGVNKELQKCSSLMETWSRLKDEEEGAGAGGAGAGAGSGSAGGPGASGGSQQHSSGGGSGSGSGSNLFSKLGAQLSSRISTLQFSSSASVLEKLGPAAAKYAELLQAHNRRAEIFLTHELPAYLHELQRLEVQRLELAAACMAAWAALSEERSAAVHAHFFHAAPASAREESSGALPRAIASLNPEADLEGTLSTLVASHGLAPSWAPQTWGLAVGLEDIKAGRVRSNAGGVFHVSLAQQMAAQQASHPLLPVPRFMLYTLAAIRSAGLGAEGVFRISPNKDEMDLLKKRLQGLGSAGLRREDFPANNVFLASALLKEWLRSLSDGVVPCRDYNSAIAIVKGTGAGAAAGAGEGASSAAAAAAPSAEQQSSAVLSLLATLPPVNQAVLALLADLSAEILDPPAQASNKMTIEALAIVLAPGLMRSSSEDPMELLQNAKHEIKFVALVLRTLIHAAQQRKGKSQLATLLEGLQ